jgi:hypothetical protein
MIKFVIDLFRYPFEIQNHNNKFYQLMQFLFKDYPAFLRNKPQLKKIIIFPFIVIAKIINNNNKNTPK